MILYWYSFKPEDSSPHRVRARQAKLSLAKGIIPKIYRPDHQNLANECGPTAKCKVVAAFSIDINQCGLPATLRRNTRPMRDDMAPNAPLRLD